MDAPDPGLRVALEELRPGIGNDPPALEACLVRLRPPKRTGDAPRRAELATLARALEEKVSPATWAAVAMAAAGRGYYLPPARDAMVQTILAAEDQIRRKRPARTQLGRQVAGACAALYFDLTHELPPVVNYRQLGPSNRYGRLCEAAFAAAGLPTWGWSAEVAAREWQAAVTVQSKSPKTAHSTGY